MALELPNPAEEAVKTAVATPPDQELTIDTIASSAWLSQQGAMAGDKWVDGKLERVFSKDEDAQDFGKVITQRDIYYSPTLQSLDAKEGDRWVDGELIPSEHDEAWSKFKHGWKTTDGLVSMTADILQSYIPLGSDLDKYYGAEFEGATAERRRQLIDLYNQREVQKSFDPYTLHQLQTQGTGGFGVVGEIAGTLADPTTLIPVGATAKAATATGAALGLGHSVISDVSKGKDIDVAKAAISTGGGAVLGYGAQKLGSAVSKKLADRKVQAAENFISQVEREIAENVSKGADPSKATIAAERKYGLKNIDTAIRLTGRSPTVVQSSKEAKKLLDSAIANDSAVARVSNSKLDQYLGVLSTRIKNISEPIFGRLRKFEFNIHKKTHDRLAQTDQWVQQLLKLNKQTQQRIGLHLSNGEFKEAMGLMPKAMQQEFSKVQKVLNDLDSGLKKSGHEYDSIPNYFPRQITDYKKFLAGQGREQKAFFNTALENFAKRQGKKVDDLTEAETNRVLNLAMRGYDSSGKINTKTLQERTIETLTPDQYQYYNDPARTLQQYIRHATHDIEKRNFFDKSGVTDELGIDTGESIGKMLSKEYKNLSPDAQDELKSLLKSRFVGGEQTLGGISAALRDTGYAGTIANPMSALVQLGDLATSGALHGLKNTVQSMFGKRYAKLVDIGVEQILSEELANPRWTGRALNKLFTLSGFRAMDRLGKETTMNAALRKNFNLVKSAKGEAEFRRKWGKIYGDEIDSMVASMKKGQIDDNIKLHAFNELADIQPIALSEMPQKYLDSRNGRLLYMLKSFVLKQYDIARRNIVQEFNQGSKLKAIKNATLLGAYLTAANTGVYVARDILQGRDVKAEDIPSRSLWALLGVYGMDKYTGERYFANGQVKEGLLNMVMPATPLIDAAFGVTTDAAKHLNELMTKPSWAVDAPNYAKYLKPVPIVGNLVYQWFLGGAEAWNEDQARKRRAANRPSWAD